MPRISRRPHRALAALLVFAALLASASAPPPARAAEPTAHEATSGVAAPPEPGSDPGATLPAQRDAATDRPVDRVVNLCKAWTTIKFLHPFLYEGETDWNGVWDRAFVDAVPAVLEAPSTAAYRRAVAGMLAVLHDPATQVEVAPASAADPAEEATTGGQATAPAEPPPLFRPLGNGVVLLDAAGFARAAGGYRLLVRLMYGKVEEELAGARGLVIDLRMPTDGEDGDLDPDRGQDREVAAQAIDEIATRLTPEEIRGPAFRWPVHWGYPTQVGSTSGEYQTAFATSMAQVIVPSDPARAPRRTVFLVDQHTRFPQVALALRAAGDARFVSEGPLDSAQVVDRISVALGEGLVARIRTTEILPGPVPFGADVVIDPPAAGGEEGDAGDHALQAALGLLDEPWDARPAASAGPTGSPGLPPGSRRPEHRYPEMTAPERPWRLLAGCRLWGTVDTFYPYLPLIGDWEGAFRHVIPELLATPEPGREEEAYGRALLHLAAAIEDGHTGLRGPAVDRVLGTAPPPIAIREIEGRWVVTDVYDLAIDDLRVGDVVETADGVPMADRVAATWPLVTASTDRARRHAAAAWSLFGAPGTSITLGVRGADGALRDVTLRRGRPEKPAPRKTGTPYHRIEDRIEGRIGGQANLGYVDLTRLRVPQVNPMFEALGDTDGLVLDLRGYPHGTGWALAARLNTRGAEVLARFRRREVSRLVWNEGAASHAFTQRLPPPDGPIYRGAIVVLIDGRAISQAEHTALGIEAASDAVFVGSPTAGTDGDVTTMVLPGDLKLWFTGHDVRPADGRQLQRIGILPDVAVEPTIAGIRAGRDEVLERGIEVLRRVISGHRP